MVVVNPSVVDTGVVKVGSTPSGGSVTVKTKVRDELPPGFVAVIVYVVADWVTVGVPVMSPVTVENDNPDGSELGEIEYELTFPPEFEIEYKLTGLSTFAVPELALNVMLGASTGCAHTMVRGVSLFGV